MRVRRVLAVLTLVAIAGALARCASSWKLRAVESPIALQWPFPPAAAKLTYARALTGLTATNDTGAKIGAALAGAEKQDANSFVLPVAVATAADGRIAVADMGRACVHLYIPASARYVRLTGSKKESLKTPVGLAFDATQRLFVCDSSGRVFAFAADGAHLFTVRTVGSRTLQRPTGIVYSPRTQLLYVVDTTAHTVHALDANGAEAFSFGGRGEADGLFNFPTHIACAPSGELLVADSLNFRVQILDERGKFVAKFGRHGDTSGDLAMPKGLAVDRDGVIYVADSLFDVVQLFDRSGRFLLTLGRRGTDFGDFWMPSGLHLSESNELYVCDTYNRRIQVFRVNERYGETR